MKSSFFSLWAYCIGWFTADGGAALLGFQYSFKEDFAVAFFIAMAWACEKWLPTPKSPADRGGE